MYIVHKEVGEWRKSDKLREMTRNGGLLKKSIALDQAVTEKKKEKVHYPIRKKEKMNNQYNDKKGKTCL